MSDRATPPADPGDPGRDHTGLDDLRSNPEICGPVAPRDDHGHANGHVALIYETRAEQLATAIPFVRDGLARGERVMYIVDDLSRADLIAALRDADVDVDAALDAGQLSIHTVAETYRRDGEFDLDAARDLLATAMEEAVAEYEGFRVTAEETWLVDDPAVQREFLTCETHVNDLLDGEDALALCQYDRDALPPDVIEDVIETHPHLIIDGTVCANDYYTPPTEYFGPADTARENDRKLSTLVDRAEARASLRDREHYERELYEITADPNRGFEEKLDALFDLGRERFGLEYGGLARVDPERDWLEVQAIRGDHDHLEPGKQPTLSETHCRLVNETSRTVSVADATAAGLEDTVSYAEFGVDAYLGTRLQFDDAPDAAFFFFSEEPRDREFTDAEHTFHHLMGQWVQYELERQQREQELRERTEHLNALVETTPDCIKTVARDGTLLQMNPAGLELAGVDAEAEVVGENVADWVAPEDRDRYRAFTERVCDGERATLEFDVIGEDGTRHRLESHAAPLTRPDGETVKVAVTRDVTEQKQRERELAKSEERYRTLVENFPNGSVGLYDEDLRYTVVGGDLLDDLGLDPDEVVGTAIDARYPDVVTDEIEPHFHAVFDGEANEFEIEVDDHVLLAHTLPVRNADGEVDAGMLMVQDVTERERTKQQLADERDMFAEGPAIMFRWEPDADAGWPVMYVSENVEDVLGYTPAELESGEITYTDLLLNEELDQIAAEVERNSDATTERFAHEPYRVRTKDGDIKWVKDTTKIVRDDTGAIDHYLGYLVDITERKERERDLERVLDLLERTERIADVGGWEIDVDTQDVFWTDHVFELLEVSGDEEPPLDDALAMYHEDDRPRVEAAVEDALASGDPFDIEARVRTGGGAVRWLRLQGVPEVADGEVVTLRGAAQDITERKERERQLAESEHRYRALAENFANGAVALVDENLRYRTVGGSPRDVADVTVDEVEGRPVRDALPAELADALAPRYEAALEGEASRFEAEYDGSIFEFRVVPVRDDDGDVFAALGMSQDITEREEYRRQLEASEHRYRALAENFPNGGVGVYDEDLRYTLVTGTMWDDIGPDAEDLEGETIWECLPPDTAADVEPVFRAALDGETGSVVSTLGGRTYRVWATPLRDADGEIAGGQSFALDITDRIERERELRESKNQLRALIDVLPVGMFVADADGEIVEWNDAAEEIWGGEIAESDSVAEYEAYTGWWADTGEPVAPEEWPMARALRGEEVTDPDVIEIEGFDGERRTVLIHGMPVRDADGEVTRATVTLTDITDREERKQRLQEQNERLESFASMLAHELRNPVTIGQIYSQQLPEDADAEAVEYVTEAFDRIEDMIDVMLVLTRGRDAVDDRTPVALAEVTLEAWADVDAPEAAFDAATDQIIQADETYIHHLFRNLFENAVEHGGADVTVEVGELPDGDGFYVADDGPGIPVEDRDRVFDEGFTTAGDNGGTGLGLAFVQKLAEVYEWDLEVTDSEDGGARFEFRSVT